VFAEVKKRLVDRYQEKCMLNMKFTVGAVLTLLIGTSGAASAHEQIQLRVDRDGVQDGASLDPRQHGYEHAYRDGADRGRFDREYGIRFSPNTMIYSDSTRGYESFMGNKGQYQKGYREGYKAGYESGYRGTTAQYGQIYGRTEVATRACAVQEGVRSTAVFKDAQTQNRGAATLSPVTRAYRRD
jgi:hypothetical protein